MASDEFGEKTEQPTERRRSDARQKGNVARSTDLNAAGLMLAVVAGMYFLGGGLVTSLGELLRHYLGNPGWNRIDRGFAFQQYEIVLDLVGANVVSLMLFLMAAAVAINLMQVGFLASPEALQPKFSRLNPVEGAKRILSIRGLVKLAVSLFKLIILTAIAGLFFSWQLPEFLHTIDLDPLPIAGSLADIVIQLAFWLAIALIVLAILDFAFQKWKHEQDLRMSKQEIREELKQMEGEPLVRQRRREAHQKLAQARELSQVRDADVVITNPTEIAVAIKYDPEKMPAPTVVAKGRGELAGRIRKIAVENGIPIIERKPLARALYQHVNVGQPIPLDMYAAFVEIMAYVYRLSGKTPRSLGA